MRLGANNSVKRIDGLDELKMALQEEIPPMLSDDIKEDLADGKTLARAVIPFTLAGKSVRIGERWDDDISIRFFKQRVEVKRTILLEREETREGRDCAVLQVRASTRRTKLRYQGHEIAASVRLAGTGWFDLEAGQFRDVTSRVVIAIQLEGELMQVETRMHRELVDVE